MATTHRLIEWTDAHRDVAFDLVRIYLGIGLFVRGWLFITDSSAFVNLMAEAGEPTFVSAAVVHYVALVHLGGGLLMAVGLLTRVAALVQVPVLVGAVFFVHLSDGLLAAGQSLEFAALVLFLLVVTVFHGSGRLSLDYYLFERDEVRAARATQLGREQAEEDRAPSPRAPRSVAQAEAERGEGVVAPGVEEPIPAGCTCGFTRDRTHPRVRVERRYGMRALRFLTGTTGTPREVAFRCLDCGNVVEVSSEAADIAHYTYR